MNKSSPESPAKEGDRKLADAKRLEFYWLDQAKISYERVAELEKLLQELLSFPSADPARNKPAGYGKGKLISIMTKNQFLQRVKTTLHLEPSSCAGIPSDGTIHQGLKEQPGEQCPKCGKSDPYWNVSSETPVILYRCGGCGEEWSRLKLEVAAPDVAAMVRRLLEFANRLARNGFSPGIAGDELILREAAALIEKLGKGWIPVRERLPRDDFHVLVHSDWDICDYTAYLRDGKWKHACGDGGPRYEIRSVTHWQPLPPPPERP